jgi:hypothetical protein
MLSAFREKIMSYFSILRTVVACFLETAVNFCHFLRLDIAEGGRQLAHYRVCRFRKVDQNYLESFEMWCRRRKEKIIWISSVKCEGIAFYEGSRRSGISNT